MKIVNEHSEILIIALILIFSALFAVIIGIKRHGDDPCYYSMVESFVNDGDFILNNKDLQRWGHNELQISPNAAYAIIDKKGVIKYAKPILYPIIAAPFFFLGIRGLALLNGLFLGGCIALSYLYLRRYFNRNNSLLIAGGFFLCSFMPAYVSWIHPEMMLYFACVLCMRFYKNKPALAALVMGIISSLRVEFFLLFVSLIMVLVFWKKFKELAKSVSMYLAGYGLMLFMTFLFLGQVSAYGGERYFIPGRIGHPYLSLQEIKGFLVSTHSMFEGSGFNSLRLFLGNIANFFIGRFTGIIWYGFPAAVCAVLYLFYRHRIKREEKIFGDVILAIMLFLAIILVIARPLNYFGGKDFVCNRYLSILPSLLFLPWIKAIKKPGKIILLFLPGLIISSQVIINDIFIKNSNRRYFAHTAAFPLKYAPLGLAQVESLMLDNIQLKGLENLSLYTPLGVKMRDGKKILLDANQEIVFVLVQESIKTYLTLKGRPSHTFLRKGLITARRASFRTENRMKLSSRIDLPIPFKGRVLSRSDFLENNSEKDIILVTNFGRVSLEPRLVLKNKIGEGGKSFYYFKADRPIRIRDIEN